MTAGLAIAVGAALFAGGKTALVLWMLPPVRR